MSQKTSLVLSTVDDYHVHLRQGEQLAMYAADAQGAFNRIMVMPNTLPPVKTAAHVKRYKADIEAAVPSLDVKMTVKVFLSTADESGPELKKVGVIAAKLYPQGVTTNSGDGASDVRQLAPSFEFLQDAGIVLSIHGESPGAFVLEREGRFLEDLGWILDNFPRLRIVLEHISTESAATFVSDGPDRLAATITAHHLLANLDQLIGGSLNPHLFCKPVLKTPQDQRALVNAAISGNPRFFFGSDSAPHLKGDKECAEGCAGVYTAPVALPMLIECFEGVDALEKLGPFVGRFGSEFYGLELSTGEREYRRESWTVPAQYHGVVPYRAGGQFAWQEVSGDR